jgi:rubrerythrin
MKARGKRRVGRGAALAAAALLAGALALAGCGEKGNPAGSSEKAHDIEVLNVAIGQERALVDVYKRAPAFVHDPEMREVMRAYVAQELEHIDGWTKSMRGLDGKVEAEAEELDYSGIETEDDYLRFAYGVTSADLTHFLEDVTQLSTSAPQSFAASIAANEAQHLVVLRQALGAGLVEAVPDAFDTGEVPPPPRQAPPTQDASP